MPSAGGSKASDLLTLACSLWRNLGELGCSGCLCCVIWRRWGKSAGLVQWTEHSFGVAVADQREWRSIVFGSASPHSSGILGGRGFRSRRPNGFLPFPGSFHLCFPSVEALEAGWEKFSADPDWKKLSSDPCFKTRSAYSLERDQPRVAPSPIWCSEKVGTRLPISGLDAVQGPDRISVSSLTLRCTDITLAVDRRNNRLGERSERLQGPVFRSNLRHDIQRQAGPRQAILHAIE